MFRIAYFPIGVLLLLAWQTWQIYPQAHAALSPHALPQLHVLPPLLLTTVPEVVPEVFAKQKNHRPNQKSITLSSLNGHYRANFKLRPNLENALTSTATSTTASTTPATTPNTEPATPPSTAQVAQEQAPPQLPPLFPNPAHALLAQGQSYQQHGQWAAARRVQQQAWQLQPSAQVAWQLALSHDQLGTRGEAKYFYRQALHHHFASPPLAPKEQAMVFTRLQQLGG